ncbi:DUF4012 domain-containing protein [Parafrankia discariae]|uniref:DUF4012 domain-containing protein n=1 Tax=Parafrankia discariae TaxID=365528 RepID=UPI00039F6196|nr:DUF4012 domain-containing protein [Parafrankia discariae]
MTRRPTGETRGLAGQARQPAGTRKSAAVRESAAAQESAAVRESAAQESAAVRGPAAGGTRRGGGDGPSLSPRREWRPDRRVVAGAALLLVVLLLAGTWIVVRGLLARSHLEAARAEISRLRAVVASGAVPEGAELRRAVDEITAQTRSARALTGDPLWSLAGRMPIAGCPLRSSADLAAALDDVAAGALPSVVELGDRLAPSHLRSGTAVNVGALAAAREPAERAMAAVESFESAAGRAADCGWLGGAIGLDDARGQVVDTGSRLHGALDTLVLATRLGPGMLGAGGPRRYLLVVQNPAESRANGGIIGGFGVLTVTDGRLELDDVTGNGTLPGGPTLARPAASLTPELAARYGAFWPASVWANANLTPDYPVAGRLYSQLYRAGTGTAVDGTISLDPTTLSYLLAATRPAVLPDGRVITAGDLVDLVESRVYQEIDDVAARDDFFAAVGEAVYAAVVSDAGAAGGTENLLRVMARAAQEGRLLVSSNHAAEQSALSSTALGGALPTAPGPFLGVVTQNASATKLDYWLRRSTSYRMERQPDGTGQATITVRLTNAAPTGLSDYVRARKDLPGPDQGNEEAQNKVWFSLYTGRGGWFAGARLDGSPVSLTSGEERGHPILSTYLTIDRGQTRTLEVRVLEPVAGPTLVVRKQPLPFPERLVVEGLPASSPWSRRVDR